MPDNDLTTIQIDVETREKLRQIADLNERSMAAQIRYWVNQEFNKIQTEYQIRPDTTTQAINMDTTIAAIKEGRKP